MILILEPEAAQNAFEHLNDQKIYTASRFYSAANFAKGIERLYDACGVWGKAPP